MAGVRSGHALFCVLFPHPMFPGHCLPLALLTLGVERQACAQSSDSIAPRLSCTLVGNLVLFLTSLTVGIGKHGHCVSTVCGIGVGLPRCNP